MQDKFSHHHIPLRKGKVLRSWLAGMIRCGYCGHAVKVDYTCNPKSGNSWIYFTCSGYNSVRGCESSRIKLKVKDVEQSVYTAMKAHIEEFEVSKKNESKPSTEEDRLKAEPHERLVETSSTSFFASYANPNSEMGSDFFVRGKQYLVWWSEFNMILWL